MMNGSQFLHGETKQSYAPYEVDNIVKTEVIRATQDVRNENGRLTKLVEQNKDEIAKYRKMVIDMAQMISVMEGK